MDRRAREGTRGPFYDGTDFIRLGLLTKQPHTSSALSKQLSSHNIPALLQKSNSFVFTLYAQGQKLHTITCKA